MAEGCPEEPEDEEEPADRGGASEELDDSDDSAEDRRAEVASSSRSEPSKDNPRAAALFAAITLCPRPVGCMIISYAGLVTSRIPATYRRASSGLQGSCPCVSS